MSQDFAQATRWFRLAASNGSASAMNSLGSLYENGQGMPTNEQAALSWYFAAATNGLVAAQAEVGWRYQWGMGASQDFSAAFAWYHCAATQGDARAQVGMATLYENGQGVTQDLHAAFRWYRMAADAGRPQAQRAVGRCYRCGRGVTQDYCAAVAWYRAAATQGYSVAECDLGYMYNAGCGVKKDDVTAFSWFLKAAEHGHARACRMVADDYEDGCGVKKDRTLAVKWNERAAQLGIADVHAKLGIAYLTGSGATTDYDKALFHFSAVTRARNMNTNLLKGAWLCIGSIHLMKGQAAEATHAFKQVWSLLPPIMRTGMFVGIAVVGGGVLLVMVPVMTLIQCRRAVSTWRTTDAAAVLFLFFVGQVGASLAMFMPLGIEGSLLLRMLVGAAVANGMVVLLSMVVARGRGWNVGRMFGLVRVPWRTLAGNVVVGWVVVAGFSMGYQLVLKLFGITLQPQAIQQLLATCHGFVAATVVLACGGIAMPVCEEFIFRSVAYQGLRARMPACAAILVSAAVFAAVHIELRFFLPLAVFGAVMAYTFERTRSILPALAIHCLHNLTGLAVALLMR